MKLLIIPLMFGTTEIVLLAAVALLLFGGKKLPQLMRSMGKGVKEFKEGIQGAPEEFHAGMNEGKEQEPQEASENHQSVDNQEETISNGQ